MSIEELKDELFVYKTMAVAFRGSIDKMLDDVTTIIDDKETKEKMIHILMHRMEEAQNYIEKRLRQEIVDSYHRENSSPPTPTSH
jgi:hypothetical protein